jgi:hypothetical protein
MQLAVVQEIRRLAGTDPRYAHVFHPPSGGKRSKGVAGKLKALGVRRGLLDLYLVYCNGTYNGWACELKVGSNQPTPEQRVEMAWLRRQGWQCHVFWDDPQIVVASLEAYLNE